LTTPPHLSHLPPAPGGKRLPPRVFYNSAGDRCCTSCSASTTSPASRARPPGGISVPAARDLLPRPPGRAPTGYLRRNGPAGSARVEVRIVVSRARAGRRSGRPAWKGRSRPTAPVRVVDHANPPVAQRVRGQPGCSKVGGKPRGRRPPRRAACPRRCSPGQRDPGIRRAGTPRAPGFTRRGLPSSDRAGITRASAGTTGHPSTQRRR
jgi:hypothetical protein